jgi:hypothetical protein
MTNENNNKSAWQKYKESLGEARPWDFLNPKTEYASETIAAERYLVCLSCPELVNTTKQCKKCGCFMAIKTKLEKAECPLGKW